MAVIGTAGHVDHGKSALVERLTGIDPDRFEEEKRRGLTIDLGFAWLTLPSGVEVGIVDVPGHERFIRNMLAGAGGLSACLFVVAATEGWKPQSAEHLAIIDTLGIRHGVVALTKSDAVDPDRMAEVRGDVEARISSTSLAGSPIVGCSARTGAGIDELKLALDETVRAAGPTDDLGRPRLWVDRVFTIKGAGTVVTGTLAGGSLREGAEVTLSPEGVRARVRSIQTHKRQVNQVGPSTRVALNLAGLERAQVERGDAIVAVDGGRATRQVDATVRVLPPWATGGKAHELTARGSHLLYIGSAEVPVRVRLLGTNRLNAGERGFARLTLRDPLPLQRGDRFVLRDAGRVLTFGGGEILDPLPGRVDRELLTTLVDADAQAALHAVVLSEGSVDVETALARALVTQVPNDIPRVGNRFLSDEHLNALQRSLLETLTDFHDEHPLDKGMPIESARSALGLEGPAFSDLVAHTHGAIEEGRLVRLERHRVSMSPEHEQQWKALERELDAAMYTPPLEDDLSVDRALLRSLVEANLLVKISNFYLTKTRAQEAQMNVRDLIEREGSATVAQIRDLLGTSRKYAVPLCEWLDASGTTIRRGDVRVLGPHAASLAR